MLHEPLAVRESHGHFDILASRHEVMLPDGTAIALHPVRLNGHDSLFHRALTTPNGLRIVFDLRKVCPALAKELPCTQVRDVPGMVFFSLRHKYRTSAELVLAASDNYESAWLPTAEACA